MEAAENSKTTAPRKYRKASRIASQFIAHLVEMRESPAWQSLPDNARRILDRLELEHAHHGGAENGALLCTYDDFERVGIRRRSIALAIRQCEALGFLSVREGRYRNGSPKAPNLYRLTYMNGIGDSAVPTHEWKAVKSIEDAKERLASAEPMQTTRRKLWDRRDGGTLH